MGERGAGSDFLEDALVQLRKYKAMAEAALSQVDDSDFLRAIDSESNSIGLIVKHVAGNLRSRWRDFRTTDGEKPDRDRDSEFEAAEGDTRRSLMERWEAGWVLVFEAVGALSAEDLLETVPIRGEPHTGLQAIQRQLTHYAYHVGQIVFLARHFAGNRWTSLSIPRGRSREFDVSRSGTPYRLPRP